MSPNRQRIILPGNNMESEIKSINTQLLCPIQWKMDSHCIHCEISTSLVVNKRTTIANVFMNTVGTVERSKGKLELKISWKANLQYDLSIGKIET